MAAQLRHLRAPVTIPVPAATWLAAGAALATPSALSILSIQAAPSIIVYICTLITGSAAVLFALRSVPVLQARTVILVAVIAHMIALTGQPAFEDDYFRFVWDGWRLRESGTPYGLAPEAFFASRELPSGFAAVLGNINHPELPTIYGPTLQAVFLAGVLLSGADPIGIRLLFAAANLALIALLLRRNAPADAALYAWSPLVIGEIVLHVHPDGIMAFFVLAALMLASRRPLLAGAMLGLAAGTKIIALAAWPLLLRTGWRGCAAAPVVLALLYAPFLAAGLGGGFDSTGTFAAAWRFNPLGFALAETVLPTGEARIAVAVSGVLIMLALHASSPSAAQTPLAAIFAVAVLLSPAVNSWYMLWILPFASGRQFLWPWLIALALPLSYLTGLNLDSQSLAPFGVHPVAYSLQVAIIIAALVIALRVPVSRLGR